MKSFENIL